MAYQSDQIQADIARTRDRMSARLDQVGTGYDRQPSTQATGITEQIRQRPLLALGLSLVAGSLLQDYLGNNQGTSPRQGARAATNTMYSAERAVANTAQTTADTVRDAASTVADTARDAASTVVDTASNVAHNVSETAHDVADEVGERAGDLLSVINEQVRQRPIVAIGLSLAAGSLLQNYLRSGQSAALPRATDSYAYGYPGTSSYNPGNALRQDANRAADHLSEAAHSAGHAVADAAQGAVDTARDAASTVADTAKDAAATVTDAAGNVASAVGNAATNVAITAVDATSSAVHQVGHAAGDAVQQVSQTFSSLTRQAQERPLTTLGVAIAAGMLLQPSLAPHISGVASDVRDIARSVGKGVGQVVSLPEPPELNRIKAALVPATVERSKQFVGHDLRDYLESSLEGVVGQTSLRAGVVAAATEKAEEFVDNRLPGFLNNLSGPTAILALGLTAAVLQARNEVQQREAPTLTNIKAEIGQSLVQHSQEQIGRYFPEFREQYQSAETQPQRCTNCRAELSPSAQFCPSCGTPIAA